MSPTYPLSDPNHIISAESRAVLEAKRPRDWMPRPLDGDDDFGFDYQIQVAPAGEVRHVFRAQLKGTTTPTLSSDGTRLSIELKRTTLNLYAGCVEPVLLLVCVIHWDGSGRADVLNSKIYFQWIHDEIRELRGSRHAIDLSDQKRVTVHVPISNELTPHTDLTSNLQQWLRRARAAETLEDVAFQGDGGSAIRSDDPLAALANTLRRHPSLVSQVLQTDETQEWVNPPPGSVEFQLLEVASHLRAYRTSLAQSTLDLVPPKSEQSPHLKAERESLQGKIFMQRLRKAEALHAFETAYSVHPREKYLVAVVETHFVISKDDLEPPALRELANRLSSAKSDEAIALRARILTLARDFDAAEALIAGLPAEKRLVPELILLTVAKRWDKLFDLADRSAGTPLQINERGIVQMIEARAHWVVACQMAELSGEEPIIPLSGPKGLDVKHARLAWDAARRSLETFRQLEWPPNINLVVDVAVASSCSIGADRLALQLLKGAADARPEYESVQEHLELVAMHVGDFRTALIANRQLPATSSALVRRTSHLFNDKQYIECLNAALEVLQHPDAAVIQTPLAYACGFASASRVTRPKERSRFEAALSAEPTWAEFLWLARVMASALSDGQHVEKNRTLLKQGLAECPYSRLLAANLLLNTDPYDANQAPDVVSLTRTLRKDAAIAESETVQLVVALCTLNEWAFAEQEARLAVERFGRTEQLLSLLAVALEMQGKTADALALLDELFAHEDTRAQSLRNYLALTLRLGLTERSRDCLDRLLAIEADREDRIEWTRLRLLMANQLEEPRDKVLALLEDLSLLVNEENEQEEALYINVYIASSHLMEMPEGFQQEFERRVETFCRHWPESKNFRRFDISAEPTAEELRRVLDSVVGDSQAAVREQMRREEQVRSGEFPIPFITRPGFAIHYVSDVFTLWRLSKVSRYDEKQLHLNTYIHGEKPPDPIRLLRDEPLLDVTALLLLQDLELFEILFAIYPRIAIPSLTVDFISQHSQGALVPRTTLAIAGALMGTINRHLSRIDQPRGSSKGKHPVRGIDVINDFVLISQGKSWVVYADDGATRAWAAPEDAPAPQGTYLTTVQFLALAEREELLTAPQIADHLARLCSWNVGIAVEPRYLVAALPERLPTSGMSVRARLDLFQTYPRFATIARAVWNFDKAPRDLLQHMGGLLAFMLRDERSSVESAAAVWAFWFYRMKQNPSWNELGDDLLNYSTVYAVLQLPPSATPRVMRAFASVVEVVAGERMTISHELAATRLLGSLVGRLMKKNLQMGERIRARVSQGFAPATAPGDSFTAGYLDAIR